MSRRMRAQLASLRISVVDQIKHTTSHYFDTVRLGNLFPKQGKRTDAKMARLVAATKNGKN